MLKTIVLLNIFVETLIIWFFVYRNKTESSIKQQWFEIEQIKLLNKSINVFKNVLTNVNIFTGKQNTDWENVFYCEFYSWLQISSNSSEKKCQFTSDIYFSLYIIRNTQGTCLEYLAYFCAGT